MELKLANDETNEKKDSFSTGGLKLAGSDGNDNSSENTNENPWDYKKEATASPSFSRPVAYDTPSVSKSTGNSMPVTISMYICYLLFALEIASMIWISTQSAIDIYDNLLKMQLFYSFCSLFVIVDVIIVQVFEEKKISLIILALFFSALYPWRRGKHTQKGEAMGVLCTVGITLAAVGIMVQAFDGFRQYGTAMQADDATRNEVVAMMDKVDENGNRYGDMLMNNLMIADIVYEQVNGIDAIVLEGIGTITFENDVFVNNIGSDIPTQLAFVKGEDGTYKIAGVQLGETMLSEHGAKIYWKSVIEK